jgi:hypothetical protein
MEIIRKQEEGVEFYTVTLTGQSGMSESGLSLLTGVTRQALSQLENTLASRAPSEFLESFVGQPLTLAISDPTIEGRPAGNLKIYKSSYCAAVLRHYSRIEETQRKDLRPATYSLVKFAEKGIDTWIQDVTGWRQWQETIQPHTDVYIKRIEHMRDHQISDDLWMIFREAAELLLLLEKDWRVPINEYDILDGSIGRRWSQYREGETWAGSAGTYNHQFRDQRGLRPCTAYKYDELPYFKQWLRRVYVPTLLPIYLEDKYGKSATRLIYTENGLLTDEILALTEVKRRSPADDVKLSRFHAARQKLLGESRS